MRCPYGCLKLKRDYVGGTLGRRVRQIQKKKANALSHWNAKPHATVGQPHLLCLPATSKRVAAQVSTDGLLSPDPLQGSSALACSYADAPPPLYLFIRVSCLSSHKAFANAKIEMPGRHSERTGLDVEMTELDRTATILVCAGH